MKTYSHNKNISQNGKPVGLAHCQQLLCRSLFDKPYEEVLTLLARDERAPVIASVYLLHYQQESLLATVDDGEFTLHFIRDRGTASDIELPRADLNQCAARMAQERGCRLVEVDLPPILGDAWEFDDMLTLAKAMGYGPRDRSLLTELECAAGPVFIGNMHSPYGLNGDWRSEVEDIGDEFSEAQETGDYSDDPRDHVIWYTDIELGMERYEFYFTLRELMRAEPVPGDTNSWTVTQETREGPVTHVVTLYR
jgi:hypothetical protein